jgi:hypothetical protein
LWLEEMASRYGGHLWVHWIIGHGQLTRGSTPARGLGKGLTTPHHKKPACYEMLCMTLDRFCGMNQAVDCIRLRTGTSGRLLWTDEGPLTSQEGLCSMQLVMERCTEAIFHKSLVLLAKPETYNSSIWKR